MSFFFTESRIESLLEQETRAIRGPDGVRVSVTGFKAMWKAYDLMIYLGTHTPEDVIELAIYNREGRNISFDRSFAAVVWNANGHARRILGIDCFAVRPTPLRPAA